MTAPPPGRMPRKKPITVPRRIAPDRPPSPSQSRQESFDFGGKDLPLDLHLDVQQNFGNSEEAHDHGDQSDPVQQFGNLERKPGQAGNVVQPDRSHDQPESGHHEGPDHGGGGQKGQDRQAQDHEREIFRRAEPEGEIHQRGSDQHQAEDPDASRR